VNSFATGLNLPQNAPITAAVVDPLPRFDVAGATTDALAPSTMFGAWLVAPGSDFASAGGSAQVNAALPSGYDDVDQAVQGDQARAAYGVTGAGIKIGIISDAFIDTGPPPSQSRRRRAWTGWRRLRVLACSHLSTFFNLARSRELVDLKGTPTEIDTSFDRQELDIAVRFCRKGREVVFSRFIHLAELVGTARRRKEKPRLLHGDPAPLSVHEQVH